MSIGNPAKAFLLAACLAASGGCDSGAAPSPESNPAEWRAPEARYRVDPARNRVWVLTLEGVALYDVKGSKRVAIPLPQWVAVGNAYGCMPDLALGPGGDAVVTSNVVPTLWKIDAETLAVTVHPLALDADTDKDVGFSALTYSAEQGAFFALSYAHGSLWRIDRQLERAQKIELSEPIRGACALAARPRGVRQPMGRFAELCVRTPREIWDVGFAPSRRSAYVTARTRVEYDSCGAS
ncbi:MAG: hypothetical protein EPO20_29065 [Betaproteobacteria bacterium]|nr:MAG: hypothetical protein EPO20_29065 [Betaproteobacteria bacterium]